jgi:hypothetical protein
MAQGSSHHVDRAR